jgi:hypothetical protein
VAKQFHQPAQIIWVGLQVMGGEGMVQDARVLGSCYALA